MQGNWNKYYKQRFNQQQQGLQIKPRFSLEWSYFLNLKRIVFNLLIAIAVCWTLPHLLKIKEYQEFIQLEAPQCMIINPNIWIIALTTMVLSIKIRSPIENIGRNFFEKILPAEKFKPGSELREGKTLLLCERGYRFAVNLLYISCLYLILRQDDCNFFDVRIGGAQSNPDYFENYPCQKIPSYLDDFYIFKLSYHLYELSYTLIYQRKRTDFPEYFLHHFLTMILIGFSYSLNCIPIGAIVMFIHDITDLAVSLFKLTADITPAIVQLSMYGLMISSWVYFRLWYFPFHIIKMVVEGSYINNHYVLKSQNGMMITFLSMLSILHCYWFYLMIKGFIRRMSNIEKGIAISSQENIA